MTLQDDIARYANKYHFRQRDYEDDDPLVEVIAAGLERDYLIERKDRLQPVGILNGYYSIAGVKVAPVDRDLGLLRVDRNYAVAVYEFAKSRESEAAALEARRDELARELLGTDALYKHISEPLKKAIDRAAAAEAELARLKGGRG